MLPSSVAAFLAYGLLFPSAPSQKSVMLRPGSSARTIASELRDAGVIRSRYAFLALHYFRVKPLKAGEYLFDRPANAFEVYDRLVRGDIAIHVVVVPEGFNLWDVAGNFEASGLATRAEFLDAARKNHAMINDLDPTAQSLEGYLFPDTYRFTRTQSLTDMLTVMTRHFRQEAKAIGLTSDFRKVVTMASIVEKKRELRRSVLWWLGFTTTGWGTACCSVPIRRSFMLRCSRTGITASSTNRTSIPLRPTTLTASPDFRPVRSPIPVVHRLKLHCIRNKRITSISSATAMDITASPAPELNMTRTSRSIVTRAADEPLSWH